jgi:hypothetical protein
MGSFARAQWVLATLCCVAVACGDSNDNRRRPAGTATPTPVPTATPEGTPTPPPQIPCPQVVTYIVDGEASDLDAGSTGNYHDTNVGTGGALTFAVDCPGDFLGQCGQCPIAGPIKSTTVVDNQRCQNASEVICDGDDDCPGSSCVFFFGAPVALSGGGFPICVTNQVANDVTGSIIPELGSGESDLDLRVVIHSGITVDRPCPTCSGAAVGDQGVCEGGPRDGEPCTTHGLTEVFGNSSFDCPPSPGASIGVTLAPLDFTTGTRTIEPAETCVGGQFAGVPCYCEGQEAPNACSDAVCTVDEDDEGACLAGPIDQLCEEEPFRSCLTDDDCPKAGDRCIEKIRGCLGPTDATGATLAPLTRTGVPSTEEPIQVGVFCLTGTSSPAVNAAAGLPGPAALRLPTFVCIFPSCP